MIPLRLCKVAKRPTTQTRLADDKKAVLDRFVGVIKYRYSPVSVKLYVAPVRRWLAFGGHAGHVERPLLIRYLYQRSETVSGAAINIDLKALRLFYRVQIDLGDCTEGELAKFPAQRKYVAKRPRPLDAGAIGHLLAALPLDDYAGLRDYALIRLILETGMRPAEIAAMETPDVLPDGLIYVHGSGRPDRYVPITEELRGVLDGYLNARRERGAGRIRAFFLTVHNKPFKNARSVWEVVSSRVWAALHRRGGVADLERAAVGRAWRGHFPSELRATCAARWLKNGIDLVAVAKLMGHSDVSTTARYLGVDLASMREAVDKLPRNQRVD